MQGMLTTMGIHTNASWWMHEDSLSWVRKWSILLSMSRPTFSNCPGTQAGVFLSLNRRLQRFLACKHRSCHCTRILLSNQESCWQRIVCLTWSIAQHLDVLEKWGWFIITPTPQKIHELEINPAKSRHEKLDQRKNPNLPQVTQPCEMLHYVW